MMAEKQLIFTANLEMFVRTLVDDCWCCVQVLASLGMGGQSRARQGRAGQGKADQGKVEKDRAGQSRVRKGRAG